MPPAYHRHRSRIATRVVACWLALALAIGGFASTRVAMLGTNHLHMNASAGAAAMAGWQDFRRAAHVGGAVARSHPHGLAELLHDAAAERHGHGVAERHHHDAADTTVASLDAAGGSAASGDAPGASVIGLPTGTAALPPEPGATTAARWADASARGIERIEAGRLERPPRA